MKKFKISLLALSLLAGGSMAASAASATLYSAYDLFLGWTNLQVWNVNGGISSPGNQTSFPLVENDTFSDTDGSGKITGGGSVNFVFNSNNIPGTTLFVDVSGKISSSSSKPTPAVTLTIKGSGFTVQDHTVALTATPASCNLKFTGTVGTNPDTNSSQKGIIVGTVSGTLTGNTPLGTKTAKVTNLPCVLESDFNNPFIDLAVLASDKKMTLWGFDGNSISGTGNIKSGTYTANLKGKNFEKGISVNLSGNMGTYTNGSAGTNLNISFTAPTTATITKGSANGQVISGAATSVSADLIH